MSLLSRDGKEQHLLMLTDLYDTMLVTEENITACANCYQLIQMCVCAKATEWPLEHVINKLRGELRLAQ